MHMQLIMLQIFNNDLNENIRWKSKSSMHVENVFSVDLNCLGLSDTVLMYDRRLLKTLMPKQ
jgi:hypothetical protein